MSCLVLPLRLIDKIGLVPCGGRTVFFAPESGDLLDRRYVTTHRFKSLLK